MASLVKKCTHQRLENLAWKIVNTKIGNLEKLNIFFLFLADDEQSPFTFRKVLSVDGEAMSRLITK
jgi:hypothetical protein